MKLRLMLTISGIARASRWAGTVAGALDLLEDELRSATPIAPPDEAELLEAEP